MFNYLRARYTCTGLAQDLLSGSHKGVRKSCVYCDVKNLDIGSAERHWKIFKAVNTDHRANTGAINFKKKVLIYGTSMHQKAICRQANLISAGNLWRDDYLQGCKIDVFCNYIINFLDAPQSNDGEVRILRVLV